MRIVLQKDELDELVKLVREAETTPVIALSSADGLRGRDWATQAWDKVRIKWDELGRKYLFNPREVKGISTETGEVIF